MEGEAVPAHPCYCHEPQLLQHWGIRRIGPTLGQISPGSEATASGPAATALCIASAQARDCTTWPWAFQTTSDAVQTWLLPYSKLKGPQSSERFAGARLCCTGPSLCLFHTSLAAFYTSKYGYKMCLRVYLNGDGTGRGTHLSLFFVVMKGPNDALLRWPFNQKVGLEQSLLCPATAPLVWHPLELLGTVTLSCLTRQRRGSVLAAMGVL